MAIFVLRCRRVLPTAHRTVLGSALRNTPLLLPRDIGIIVASVVVAVMVMVMVVMMTVAVWSARSSRSSELGPENGLDKEVRESGLYGEVVVVDREGSGCVGELQRGWRSRLGAADGDNRHGGGVRPRFPLLWGDLSFRCSIKKISPQVRKTSSKLTWEK